MVTPEVEHQFLAYLKTIVAGQGKPSEVLEQSLRIAARYHWVALADRCVQRWGPVVQGGPFAGMIYPFTSDCVMPRLLGAYESELHETLALLAREPFRTILNLGCGEGYYAVGLARLFPAARVLAFDTEPAMRRQCLEMAQANRVANRLQIEGTCRMAHLLEWIDPPCLILCDCEGAEVELMDPDAVPSLRACHLIVEAHEFLRPGVSQLLASRFEGSHQVRILPPGPRNPFAYENLQPFSEFDRFLALAEDRSGTTPFVVMIPDQR